MKKEIPPREVGVELVGKGLLEVHGVVLAGIGISELRDAVGAWVRSYFQGQVALQERRRLVER